MSELVAVVLFPVGTGMYVCMHTQLYMARACFPHSWRNTFLITPIIEPEKENKNFQVFGGFTWNLVGYWSPYHRHIHALSRAVCADTQDTLFCAGSSVRLYSHCLSWHSLAFQASECAQLCHYVQHLSTAPPHLQLLLILGHVCFV